MQIYVPTQNPADWKRLLAKASHWKAGHSAMALARSWEDAKKGGGPPEVRRVLGPLTLLLAIPEFKVDLPPTGGRPSQTDLFVLAADRKGLVAISIEGKVNESFGPTLEERRADPSRGVHERIRFLLKTLKLPADIPDSIRYQSAAPIGRSSSGGEEVSRAPGGDAGPFIQPKWKVVRRFQGFCPDVQDPGRAIATDPNRHLRRRPTRDRLVPGPEALSRAHRLRRVAHVARALSYPGGRLPP